MFVVLIRILIAILVSLALTCYIYLLVVATSNFNTNRKKSLLAAIPIAIVLGSFGKPLIEAIIALVAAIVFSIVGGIWLVRQLWQQRYYHRK